MRKARYFIRTTIDRENKTVVRNCTLRPPEYTLFHEYRQRHNDKVRTFRDRLFSSSKLEKIINYINENL